ncbi:thiamine pyrophosphokinase [Cryomyces antarcticus]|uniref:Thiamine pyrophosphokinase n=1 Tax=Cryomyces antarcticus TaxID=329879 RepID=A0ABR0LXH3_9PEZI|nr:thiamine pyrophosphokinase [Cryomyces antarcticus]KAK5003097.1 thiamine pyrophosphokinase [Cryomyces antarcticus]KAK5140145.1 hypothetical protein LTR04_003135 [Oleoguttula sp. CCFEE 6159]KAK5246722.1 thiamine pyrophosphokinase [Cryomyces antarcticus]
MEVSISDSGRPATERAAEFRPVDFLRKGHSQSGDLYNAPGSALLILNQPIEDAETFDRIWQHTSYRLCADGGANRLYDMVAAKYTSQTLEYLPSIVHGDLDSLRDDVRTYYLSRGVDVSRDPDQYSSDFGKAMQKISQKFAETPNVQRKVLIHGSLGGRVDQGIGMLHEMFREQLNHPALQMWLFSESSISFILLKGTSIIHTPMSEAYLTPNVGILPIYGLATISTKGLEWDVKDWKTSMGTQVSTSNHIVADRIAIETDAPVLFTVERAPELPA